MSEVFKGVSVMKALSRVDKFAAFEFPEKIFWNDTVNLKVVRL